MALVPCPECNSKISDQVQSCPSCGFPLQPGLVCASSQPNVTRTPDKPTIPLSLMVIAALFILSGAVAALAIILKLLNGNLHLNLGVLGLAIGPGLLALRPGWRTCAVIYLWIVMIASPIVAFLMLCNADGLTVSCFGRTIASAPSVFGAMLATVPFAVALWSHWVLTRPEIRTLFGT